MLRELIYDYSLGNDLRRFWRLFYNRERVKSPFLRRVLSFLLNRSAHRHGGYIGPGAKIEGIPSLPHGLHGIYISRYASIGSGCRIYQGVTIGERDGRAPTIGEGCLIGANACLIGGISVGRNARIGAGAVIATDVPANCTVVAVPPRVIARG